MDYILYLDWGAVVVFLIILFDFGFKKKIKTSKTEAFYALALTAFFSVISDIAATTLLKQAASVPMWLNYGANILFFLVFNLTAPVFLVYVLTLTDRFSRMSRKYQLLLFLPYAISAGMILTTPVTHGVFYFSDTLAYLHGPLFYVLHGIAEFYLVWALAITVRNRALLTQEQQLSSYCFSVGPMLAVLIQMLMPTLIITQFTCSVTVLMVYMTMQNPSDYYNRTTDSLNRKAFIAILDERIRRNRPVSVVALQLTDVEQLNRSLGFASTDRILRSVADRLKQMSGSAMFFEISGKKFAFVADENAGIHQTLPVQIRELFAAPLDFDNLSLPLTISACCISVPETAKTSEEVVSMIDYYLEIKSKENMGTIMLAEKEVLHSHIREERLLALLREAIVNDGFEVYYQPLYSVEEDSFTDAEALVRLKSTGDFGFASPEEFIPLAEKNGLIQEIGRQVFCKVCQFLSESCPPGLQRVNVNLSVVQCMQEDLHEKLLSLVDSYGIRHDQITLEITETSAACTAEILKNNMSKLIASGIEFEMDDYGTGFSGTSYLLDYPFAVVKLDKHIVWEAFKSEKAMNVLKYTVQMIKSLHMKIVAEGVETDVQAAALRAMGCDLLQGYLFSKPVPQAELTAFLSQNCLHTK